MNYLRPVASSLSKHGSDTPARAKDIERFGETVVVDNPSIHWKYSHEENNVTARKYHAKHLERERTPWFVVAQMTK